LIVLQALSEFAEQEQLPSEFVSSAERWFLPLITRLQQKCASHQNDARRPLVLGINGAQGSGKSTLSALIVKLMTECYDLRTVAMSLDDFYLSKSARQALAKDIHPLLRTRGVPGTHNIHTLKQTINNLLSKRPCVIPRFDKSTDDVADKTLWQSIESPCDLIVLEGWCVGTPAQTPDALKHASNELERSQDGEHIWRNYVNQTLDDEYQAIFAKIDYLVMLKAPSFDCIYRWRLQQEHKMQQRNLQNNAAKGGMSDAEIFAFIQYYQRITEHGLARLPAIADEVFELDQHRSIISCHSQ
jgi:D-glycerate 3-kinase